MKGTDHACSLEPDGLRRIVRDIHNMEIALGDGHKHVSPAVQGAKAKLRRSLVSKCEIPAGTVLTDDMLCLKSPGTGLMWTERTEITGKRASGDIPADVTLSPEDFE